MRLEDLKKAFHCVTGVHTALLMVHKPQHI